MNETMKVKRSVDRYGNYIWEVLFDRSKSTLKASWKPNTWIAFFTGFGPRGGINGFLGVPISILEEIVHDAPYHEGEITDAPHTP
jgi:hypothetical protein